MKGDALANMLQDRRILVIIVAVIVIIAAAAAYMVLKDDGKGGSDDPSDGLTIDNERTISEDMVIEGDLVITDKGKLTLADGATISMLGPNAKIDVKGTLDATDGSIEFIVEDEEGNYSSVYNNSDKGTRSITSTGTMTISGENFESTDHFDNYTGIKNFVNSATYDNEPNVVLTSVAKALAAKDDVKIYGTISEAGEISLSEKKSIILVEDANATLGTIKLVNGADVDLTSGTLTSTISNSAGSVSLSKASGITVGSVANGSTSMLMLDGDLDGAITVSTGTVNVDVLSVDNTGSSMTVAAGATLALQEIGTTVKGDLTTIPSDSQTNSNMTINGIVVVGTKPIATTSGTSTNPGINGKFTLGTTGYLKVYGNTTGFTVDSTVPSTVFQIDSLKYMTVYGNATISSILSSEKIEISSIKQDDFVKVSNWNDTQNMSGKEVASDTKIGADGYKIIYFASVKVELTVTLPANVTLNIDGFPVKDKVTLAAGSHTFSVMKADEDTNSYVLKLDGVECSGSSFTVDAGDKVITVEVKKTVKEQQDETAD